MMKIFKELKLYVLKKFSGFLLREYNLITEDDILRIHGEKWIVKNRELLKGEIVNLQSDAEVITRTQLWKFYVNEIKWHAQKRATIDAKDDLDLLAAKQLIYLAELTDSFFRRMQK